MYISSVSINNKRVDAEHPAVKVMPVFKENTRQPALKIPSLGTLQAYYLTGLNRGKQILFTSSPKYNLSPETGTLDIAIPSTGKAILHWGVDGWKTPPENVRPTGTVLVKGAVQSPMTNSGNEQKITIPQATTLKKINYALYYPEKNDWDNNNNKNYEIDIQKEIRKLNGEAQPALETANLVADIAEKENEDSLNWNIATRFDFMSEVLDKLAASKDMMALLACYVDFSVNHLPHRKVDSEKGLGLEATRKNALRFGHLAASTEKLAAKAVDQLKQNPECYPEVRNIIKNLRGATGNLEGLGSFIQKESLNIVRDSRWRNFERYKGAEDGRRTYLFQLQRKLHNALNPDDVKIMDAYIEYLKSGGNMDVYHQQLALKKVDMNEYQKYFTNKPIYHQNDTAGLIEKIKGLRDATEKFFEGPGIDESIKALDGIIKGDLKAKLEQFVKMADKATNPGQVLQQLAAIRPAIKESFASADTNALKNLLALDIKLEEIGNLAVKKLAAEVKTDESGRINITENLLKHIACMLELMACDGYENKHSDEIKIVRQELEQQIKTMNLKDPDWNLQTKLTFDRMLRILGNHENATSSLYQKPAHELTKVLILDDKIGKEYTEHLHRLQSGFDISKLLQKLRSETRKNAGLPHWDVVSKGSTQGKVMTADTLYDIPPVKGEKNPVIAILNKVTGSEEIPAGVKAIICGEGVDVLSHLGIRARQDGVALLVCDDKSDFEKIKQQFSGKLMKLTSAESDVKISHIDKIVEAKKEAKEKPVIKITPMNVKNHPVLIKDYTLDTVGPKSYNLGLLAGRLSGSAKVPDSISVLCGMFDDLLKAPENRALVQKYYEKINLVDSMQTRKETAPVLDEIKDLVTQMKVPTLMQKEIEQSVQKNLQQGPKMVRSSYNGEDLEKYAGAGLYDSYPSFNDSELIPKIKDVWASKWNYRAYWSRRENNISHNDIQPTVLVQELIPVDHSFVIHTVHPITNNKDEVIIQLAQGLGEAIVSGHYPGQAYTFIYNKKTGEIKRTSFANKSEKLVMTDRGFEKVLASYVDDKYKKAPEKWERQIKDIAKTALEIESKWGNAPQDIEGGIKDDQIYILQTRNQVFHD